MKIKSKNWISRTINMPLIGVATFDQNGVCDKDCTEEQANFLVKEVTGIEILPEEVKEKVKEKTKEDVLEKKTELDNKEQLDTNTNELANEKAASDPEKQKQENIEKINKIRSVAKLKELAESFPKEEWEAITNPEELKKYLISKI